jgi:hypothetical protein
VSADQLVMAIVSALVAGDVEAVEALLLALSRLDASRAAQVLEAMKLGSRARSVRQARETAEAVEVERAELRAAAAARGTTSVMDRLMDPDYVAPPAPDGFYVIPVVLGGDERG